jgi:hypothetical protein
METGNLRQKDRKRKWYWKLNNKITESKNLGKMKKYS